MASKKWDDDYDPHKERHVGKGLTHCESLTHVIKGCLGTGLLALPKAFSQAGTINGFVLFIVISIFGTYCFHVLVRSQYLLCKIKKVGFLTYAQSVEAAFEVGPQCFAKMSKCGGVMVNIFFVVFTLGSLCVYALFMGANLKMVVEQYFEQRPVYFYVFFIFLLCIALCFVPDMKVFTPLSVFANLVSVLTVGVIGWYVCQNLPAFSSRPAIGDWRDFPLFFGTSVFALLSVPIVILVENNMEDPAFFRKPLGTLNVAFGVVTTLYAVTGLLGYWRYGNKIESVITLNFPDEEVLAQTIRSLYMVAVWITFGLNILVPRDIIWAYLYPRLEEASNLKKKLIDYTIRCVLVVITFIFALCLPLLGPLISLVGGVCLSIIGIILPGLLELCALWPDHFGLFKWQLLKDSLIILIGIFGLFSSMHAAIRDIVDELNKESWMERMQRGDV